MSNFNENLTKEYYESFGHVYEAVWDEQIHTGLFDVPKSLKQATQDMNTFLAMKAKIRTGSNVLIAGCGRGGTDRFLAKTYGGHITGIDISEQQLNEAELRAKAEGQQESIRYILGSMTAIPLPDHAVEYIWIQESLFHCHDKRKAVSEFNRVLTPGGMVILEDTVLGRKEDQDEVLETFGKRVRIDEILTAQDLSTIFKSQGFSLVQSYDLSQHLSKTYASIVEYIKDNRDAVRPKIDPQYYKALEHEFGFPASLRLVNEGKLGCYAMFFQK